MVRRPADRSGAEEGEVCFTSADTYSGVILGVILLSVRGVSVSESDEGIRRCEVWVAGVTGTGWMTGAGVEAGEGDKGESGDSGVVVGISAHALLLVVSGTILDGRRDRLVTG